MDENRTFRRVAFRTSMAYAPLPVHIDDKDAAHVPFRRGRVQELSARWVGVKTDHPLPEGTELLLCVQLGAAQDLLWCVARTGECEERGDGYFTGIELRRLPPREEARLVRVVSDLQRQHRTTGDGGASAKVGGERA